MAVVKPTNTLWDPSTIPDDSVCCTITQSICCLPCSLAQSAKKIGLKGCCYSRVVLSLLFVMCIIGGLAGSTISFVGQLDYQAKSLAHLKKMQTDSAGCAKNPKMKDCATPMPGMLMLVGDVVRAIFQIFQWIFFGMVTLNIRNKTKEVYGMQKSCCNDCCYSFFCTWCVASEQNLLYKGYIDAGCCGEAVDDSKDVTLA